jgi:hypothetical protein
MCRFRRISRLLPIAALIAAFLEIAFAIDPVPVAASPANGLIQQEEGSKVFENGTGFMWGTNGSSFVIARTQDNGKTWSKESLAGVSIDLGALATASGGRLTSVYVHFADPDHGWIAWATDDSVFHIASSSDSGASWRDALSLQTDAVLDRRGARPERLPTGFRLGRSNEPFTRACAGWAATPSICFIPTSLIAPRRWRRPLRPWTGSSARERFDSSAAAMNRPGASSGRAR